jgi:drug/metabolite transporter (DMT)-like permease
MIILYSDYFIKVTITGLISAYYEKILKFDVGNVWERSLQLAFLSAVFYLISFYLTTTSTIFDELSRWNFYLFFVCSVGASGGVLVALCTKYLSSISKCVALSFSVLFTVVIANFLFDSVLTMITLLGAVFVIGGTFMYSQPDYFERFIGFEQKMIQI